MNWLESLLDPLAEHGFCCSDQALSQDQRKAWLEGSWDVFEGQVFSEWNRNMHVVEPFQIPTDWKRYIAMDLGVNAPFSVGWYARGLS